MFSKASCVPKVRKKFFHICCLEILVTTAPTKIGYPVFDHAGRVAAALVVPFLEFLDGSHPVKIDAAQTAIEKTAQQITAGLGH